MGTNFYWADAECEDRMDPAGHIGKRSAAGMYCWGCGRTLCADGEEGIHFGKSRWLDACPKCGSKPKVEPLTGGAVGVELGFAKPRTGKPSGVASCSSFSWAQSPWDVVLRCQSESGEIVVDEYGRKMTGKAFLAMVKNNCPVTFTHSIGKYFS